MTAIVDHSSDHDLTVQGNQAARGRALVHLTEATGLPTVDTWLIDATTKELAGWLIPKDGESPTDLRRKVQAWADFLHFEVTEDVGEKVTTLMAAGVCEYGVRVVVWTQVRNAIEEVAA